MLKKSLGIFFTLILIFLLNTRNGNTPPLGKFLDPFNGYSALINIDMVPIDKMIFNELYENVDVIWDSLRIPHIFAKNEHDLFFIQGYITAFDRLWQMEFQTHAAAGRLSEILGEKALGYDRFQRRVGMVYGAKNTLEEVKKDSLSYANLLAYTDGINKFIESIHDNQYPLEYKILDYKPEKWTPLKTSLLLKRMAWTLTGRSTDLVYTRILNNFGNEVINELFPIFPPSFEPIIPRGTKYNFKKNIIEAPSLYKTTTDLNYDLSLFPIENVGSNNWALHGSRTLTGNALLSNDPHLELNLPSIWYLIHLHCPTINSMGVSIPGAPGIIIGFNENISWGVTNGNDDVMDWYDVTFIDSTKNEYLYDNSSLPIIRNFEEFTIRNSNPFIDTVLYTHHGPIVWDFEMQTPPIGSKNSKNKIIQTSKGRALRWIAHDPSNELKSFIEINKASNYEEFKSALLSYKCPGQNFIFADKNGDIAIIHTGTQPTRWFGQGRFIGDGSNPQYDWGEDIPYNQKPQIKNPRMGYISSANQHPTDESYPYFLSGGFWMSYRAMQINRNLDTLYKANIDDMKNIQLNNKYGVAENILPALLKFISNDSLTFDDSLWIEKLKNWDYSYSKTSVEATFFDNWLNEIEELTWNDDFGEEDSIYIWPHINILDNLINNKPNSTWFDIKTTHEIETIDDLSYISFKNTAKSLLNSLGELGESWQWGYYRGTDINHIAQIPGLGVINLKTDGGPEIINATGKTFGPSFRYNIEMSNTLNIIGIYPGGQSGFPGSYYYDNFIHDWSNGIYYTLQFDNSKNNIDGKRLTCTRQ